MKKLILATSAVALSAISAQAFATDACGGFTTASRITITTGSFIKQSFAVPCSANVYMGYAESDTDIAVCSGSAKGNFRFGGSSSTGSVVPTGTKGTAATQANTAATIAAGGCSAPT